MSTPSVQILLAVCCVPIHLAGLNQIHSQIMTLDWPTLMLIMISCSLLKAHKITRAIVIRASLLFMPCVFGFDSRSCELLMMEGTVWPGINVVHRLDFKCCLPAKMWNFFSRQTLNRHLSHLYYADDVIQKESLEYSGQKYLDTRHDGLN